MQFLCGDGEAMKQLCGKYPGVEVDTKMDISPRCLLAEREASNLRDCLSHARMWHTL